MQSGCWAETLRPLINEAIHRFRLRDEQGRSLLNHGRIWLFELSKFPGQSDDEVFVAPRALTVFSFANDSPFIIQRGISMLQTKTRLPWLLLLFWLPMTSMTSAFAQPDLTVGSATGRPGETVTLPVSFTNNGTVVAMSFDINFNPKLVTPGAVTPGAGLAPHTVATNLPTPGTLRVLVSPPIVNPLPIVKSGVLLTVPWTMTASAAVQANIPLNLGNVAFGNARSAAVPAGALTSGSISP